MRPEEVQQAASLTKFAVLSDVQERRSRSRTRNTEEALRLAESVERWANHVIDMNEHANPEGPEPKL